MFKEIVYCVQTLQKYDNVVLATTVGTGLSNEKAEVRATEPTYDNIFYDVDKNIGVTNIIKDRDNVCRSYFPLLEIKGMGNTNTWICCSK